MKKIISLLLCLTMLFSVFIAPNGTVAQAASNGLDYITTGETQTLTWGEEVKNKYAYLTVNETGFYDLSIEDLNQTSKLSLYMTDLDFGSYQENAYNMGASIISESITGVYTKERIYLIKDHLYEISCYYYAWVEGEDGTYNEVYSDANIKLTFSKTDYQPSNLQLNINNNLVLGGTLAIEWFYFTSDEEGDYTFNFNQSVICVE